MWGWMIFGVGFGAGAVVTLLLIVWLMSGMVDQIDDLLSSVHAPLGAQRTMKTGGVSPLFSG